MTEPRNRVAGSAGLGDSGYAEGRVNVDPGEADDEIAAKADAVGAGRLEDPAVANAMPHRVRDGKVVPATQPEE